MALKTGSGGGNGNAGRSPISTDMDRAINEYVAKVANGQITQDEGRELITDQARNIYDSEQGEAIAREALEIEQSQGGCDEVNEERRAVRARRQGTREWVRASNKNGKRDQDETAQVSFKEWSFLHQGIFVLCIALSFVMLGAGAANIQGNLVNSGLPIFTTNPVFAWLFAMLAPGAALAIHSFGEGCRTSLGRNRYRSGVFILTGLSVAVWSWLFADLFHSTGGGLDLSFEEDALTDKLFVWFQILAEIMVGASLFLIAEHTASHYSPDFYVRNTEYVELLVREEALQASLNRALERLNTLRGQQNARLAAREAVVGRALAEFLQRLHRFGDR